MGLVRSCDVQVGLGVSWEQQHTFWLLTSFLAFSYKQKTRLQLQSTVFACLKHGQSTSTLPQSFRELQQLHKQLHKQRRHTEITDTLAAALEHRC